MTLRSSDLQSDSDLDSIRNSCDVFFKNMYNDIFLGKGVYGVDDDNDDDGGSGAFDFVTIL